MALLKLTLKNIADKKIRFALTLFAVLIGVSFVVGTFVITDSLRSSFDSLSDDIGASADLTVRNEVAFGDQLLADPLPVETLDTVREVDGVNVAEGSVAAIGVVVVKADGEPLEVNGPPQLGVTWPESDEVTTFFPATDDSRRPIGPDEFALDTRTAQDNDFVIGDTYTVQLPTGPREMTLTAYANFADPDESAQLLGAQLTVFDPVAAVELLNGGDGYNAIIVDVSEGADVAAVADRIEGTLGGSIEVVDSTVISDENAEDFDAGVSIFQNILLAFAIVILIVCAFLISNTFNIVLGQRIKELGLLRAIGATGSQITRTVLGEALVVGIVATAAGIAGGVGLAYGLRGIFSLLGLGLPAGTIELPPRTIIAAVVVGVGITMVSALAPALKARRVSPMAALSETSGFDSSTITLRPLIGTILYVLGWLIGLVVLGAEASGIAVGAILGSVLLYQGGARIYPFLGRSSVAVLGLVYLLAAAFGDFGTGKLVTLLAVGALVMFVGVNLLSPLFATRVARAIGAPLPRLFGVTGRLSRENAARTPRRTSATAAALMIGLALVGTATIMASSLKATFAATLEDSVQADWFVCVGNCSTGGTFPNEFAQSIGQLDEIESVVSYQFQEEAFRLLADNGVKDAFGADLSMLDEHLDADVVEGNFSTAGEGDIGLSTDKAEDLRLSVGDPVEVQLVNGTTETLNLAAVYDDARIVGDYVIDNATLNRWFTANQDIFVSAVTAEGFSDSEAFAAMAPIGDQFPQLEIRTQQEYQDTLSGTIDDILIIINVFLGLAVIVALIGIVNTLTLSVFERTRELGLLRAVGMTRRQMRKMVRWEGFIIATFGGVLGTLLGVLFGVITVEVIPAEFIDRLDVPYVQLVIFLLVAAFFGLVSALLPARRAARLNVLDAISHE
jgi:putative ABC transport system permease protein